MLVGCAGRLAVAGVVGVCWINSLRIVGEEEPANNTKKSDGIRCGFLSDLLLLLLIASNDRRTERWEIKMGHDSGEIRDDCE